MESIERSLSLVSTFGPTLLVSSCRLRGSGLHSARSFVTSKFMSRLYPVPSLSLTSSSFLSMHLKPNFVQRRALSVIKSRPVSSLLAQSYRIPCEENLSEKDSKLQTKPELKDVSFSSVMPSSWFAFNPSHQILLSTATSSEEVVSLHREYLAKSSSDIVGGELGVKDPHLSNTIYALWLNDKFSPNSPDPARLKSTHELVHELIFILDKVHLLPLPCISLLLQAISGLRGSSVISTMLWRTLLPLAENALIPKFSPDQHESPSFKATLELISACLAIRQQPSARLLTALFSFSIEVGQDLSYPAAQLFEDLVELLRLCAQLDSNVITPHRRFFYSVAGRIMNLGLIESKLTSIVSVLHSLSTLGCFSGEIFVRSLMVIQARRSELSISDQLSALSSFVQWTVAVVIKEQHAGLVTNFFRDMVLFVKANHLTHAQLLTSLQALAYMHENVPVLTLEFADAKLDMSGAQLIDAIDEMVVHLNGPDLVILAATLSRLLPSPSRHRATTVLYRRTWKSRKTLLPLELSSILVSLSQLSLILLGPSVQQRRAELARLAEWFSSSGCLGRLLPGQAVGLISALAEAGVCARGLYVAVIEECGTHRSAELTAVELVELVSTCGALNLRKPELLECVVPELCVRVASGSFVNEHLAILVSVFAELENPHTSLLLEAVVGPLSLQLSSIAPKTFSRLMSSLRHRFQTHILYSRMCSDVPSIITSFRWNPTEVARLASIILLVTSQNKLASEMWCYFLKQRIFKDITALQAASLTQLSFAILEHKGDDDLREQLLFRTSQVVAGDLTSQASSFVYPPALLCEIMTVFPRFVSLQSEFAGTGLEANIYQHARSITATLLSHISNNLEDLRCAFTTSQYVLLFTGFAHMSSLANFTDSRLSSVLVTLSANVVSSEGLRNLSFVELLQLVRTTVVFFSSIDEVTLAAVANEIERRLRAPAAVYSLQDVNMSAVRELGQRYFAARQMSLFSDAAVKVINSAPQINVKL